MPPGAQIHEGRVLIYATYNLYARMHMNQPDYCAWRIVFSLITALNLAQLTLLRNTSNLRHNPWDKQAIPVEPCSGPSECDSSQAPGFARLPQSRGQQACHSGNPCQSFFPAPMVPAAVRTFTASSSVTRVLRVQGDAHTSPQLVDCDVTQLRCVPT